MGYISILTVPNPVLREKCVEVAESDIETLKYVVPDLTNTIKHYKGVGLAANQIGYTVRMIAIYHEIFPEPLVLVNPIFNPDPDSPVGLSFEGCLSIPKTVARLPRYVSGTVTARTPEFEEVVQHVTNELAIVIQHEIDHLNGVLMTDYADSVAQV